MQHANRIDLSRNSLLLMLAAVFVIGLLVVIFVTGVRPGSVTGQLLALLGSGLLLVPFAFSALKRSSVSISPPSWFVAHVICASLGVLFILGHAASGDWVSPPGLLLGCLCILIAQGYVARALLAPRISELFAAQPASFGYGGKPNVDKKQLSALIEQKQTLLKALDSSASEALFSPHLSHWLKHPLLALRYNRLASQEAGIVGSRNRAGLLMRWWRPVHILLSILFLLGLIAHVVVVLFFAGYVAGDQPIDWWHITDWGRPA